MSREPLSAEIEAAHSTHQKSISVRSGNHQIRIDLAELYQIVLPVPDGDASSKRKVRRWHPLEFAVPQTWDHMPADGEIHTVDVPESSVDWIKCSNVLHKFDRTKFRLVRLQRIQNLQCLRAYEAERTNLSKRRGPACLNEQYVLHGTKHTARTRSHRFAPALKSGTSPNIRTGPVCTGWSVGLLVGCTGIGTGIGTGSMVDTGWHQGWHRLHWSVAIGTGIGTGWHCIGWHRLHWSVARAHAGARMHSRSHARPHSRSRR